MLKIGVLGLQGAVQPHLEKFSSLGVSPSLVLSRSDLQGLSGILLPGGESTTQIHLLETAGLWNSLADFIQTKPIWGICAGSILLAKEVSSPHQKSFKALDILVSRNAYGRQSESFVAPLEGVTPQREPFHLEGVFIRAPQITHWGKDVQVLASYQDKPVFVRQGRVLASTFHPELSDSCILHESFLKLCQNLA